MLIVSTNYDAIAEQRGNYRPGTILERFYLEGSEYFRITAINKTKGTVRGFRVDDETAKKEIATYYRNC